MSYFEMFKINLINRFNKDTAQGRIFSLLFNVDEEIMILVKVDNGNLSVTETESKECDLEFTAAKEIYNRIIDEDDILTGVDSYFSGDLELDGDRGKLEDLFEVFGIV